MVDFIPCRCGTPDELAILVHRVPAPYQLRGDLYVACCSHCGRAAPFVSMAMGGHDVMPEAIKAWNTLSAPEASGADYVMVPRKATLHMLDSGRMMAPARWGEGSAFDRNDAEELWDSMLAAAPINPAPPTSGEEWTGAAMMARLEAATGPTIGEVEVAEVIQNHTGCADSDSIYAAHAVLKLLRDTRTPADESGAAEDAARYRRHDEAIEREAESIYNAMPYDGKGQKPAWVPHGNSLKQDEARDAARRARGGSHD